MRSTKLIIVLIISIFVPLMAKMQVQQSPQEPFSSWFNYKKDRARFILSNPINSVKIEFLIPGNQMQPRSISITKEGYWKSSYSSDSIEIDYIAKSQNIRIQLTQSKKNTIQFSIQSEQNDLNQNLEVDHSNICQSQNLAFKCTFQSNKTKAIIIHYINQKNRSQLIKNLKTSKTQNQSSQLFSFLSALNIKSDSRILYETFAKQMLTHTLSSLCVQQSQYEGYQFFGFCSNSNPKQIDKNYSPLVINLLFGYNSELGIWLTENFINLLQQKLFYTFNQKQWIALPEHIDLFKTYIKHLTKNKSLDSSIVRKQINKIIEIQNGFINNLLLSEVNHLSEEINYRQNNKIHPTIKKMITQAWKTNSSRARVSSIYAQSFTSDFFYHQKNQKLEFSVGKMAWLIKLISQHTIVVQNYGDSHQKESLEQLVSLSKLMNLFFLDEPRAKNGDFYSTIQAQNLKIYTKSIGYQSLLPFSYQISSIYPVNAMESLKTAIGLASLPSSHQRARENYNFRGNINLYFNYKILFDMVSRCSSKHNLKEFYLPLKSIIESVQKQIILYFQNRQNQKPGFYTSWTINGKGVKSQNYLAVINLAFMQQPKNLSAKKSSSTSHQQTQATE